MKKVKLIIGTVNAYPMHSGIGKLEEIYENSYKPYLKMVHGMGLPVTMYYSGELLSWLLESNDGMQMLINDIVKKKNIEFLGGGYYSPLFSLIPRKDRVGQIELMTTALRKYIGRRSRGMWISEKVWEPSMPMTMNNAGIEFTFIDEAFFEDAGLFNGELYRPCLTEDQGKKVVIFPISNRIISRFLIDEPENIIEQIIACGSEKEERVISIMVPGEELDFSKGVEEHLNKFHELLKKNKKQIEVVLPGSIVRELTNMKKVYFGCVSPGDIGRWSGPIFREQQFTGFNDEGLSVDSGKSTAIENKPKPFNSQSFFRHFLAKYPESNFIYSRMIYTHNLISQIRGDKQRKKAAEVELYKSQNNAAYWHGGGSLGIYSAENRRFAYANLIEAEKFSRERVGFRASLVSDDFDMDGINEFIYRGLSINAFVHRKGGTLFELDYIRTPHNYIATMARHHEWYHDENEINDVYTRNSFVDHFFSADVKKEKFFDMDYAEAGDFISGVYKINKLNKEQKKVELVRCGSVFTKKKKFPVEIKKTYTFKRNYIDVEYEIINKSDAVLNTTFASEMNICLSSPEGRVAEISVQKKDVESIVNEPFFEEKDVSEILVKDFERKARVDISTKLQATIWGGFVSTKTGTGIRVESIYQSDCFLYAWNISLGPGKVWANSLQIKIDRLEKRTQKS
ncbi:MAG: DUF1926 domain-containing protein [Spirochaetales bacterium]|nr:DUF1926 domain-containing protein [Spirochaetales bacterium]